MRTFSLAAAAAAAVLAGCGGNEPVTPAPTSSNAVTSSGVAVNAPPPGTVVVAPQAAVPQPQPSTVAGLYAGTGRVVSVTKLQSVPSTGNGTGSANRVALAMDSGIAQYVDTYANLTVGERVEILNDGRIRYAR